MTETTARITWLSREQGGRKSPPAGPRYITPARFEAASDRWPDEAWSLVVDLLAKAPGSEDWIAKVHFLVNEAPHDLLREGARFELYEGKNAVAEGTVLPPAPQTPPSTPVLHPALK